MTKIAIRLDLETCIKCPLVDFERTKGAGYALDYFCTAMKNKKIMGYIELIRDHKPVPDWCPHRTES